MSSHPFAVAIALITLAASPVIQAQEGVPAPRVHVVQPGETLSGLVRKLYPNSPLREPLLRDALRAGNPQAFMKDKPTILLAGATLQVPDHVAMVEQQYKLVSAVPAGDDGADDPPRKWVRYP